MNFLAYLLRGTAWAIALISSLRVFEAHRGLPKIPDLLLPAHDVTPEGLPTLTVVVPARDEAANIQGCLLSLLAQDYVHMRIVAVDDRSTDATGAIMDALAAEHPGRLRTMHVDHLPEGWLGKTHAMAIAARGCESDFLLFTDADILFRPDALRRALANAVATGADHLVLIPTTIIHRWDEAALLAFFQMFGLWAARPWKVANPRAKRDAIGIGAFNLLRRSAYEAVGGFTALRMEIVEDLGIARRIKRSGFAPRVAFGKDMVRVHWAPGVGGLVQVLTKNIFSAFNFHISLLLGGCGWLALFCVGPFVTFFLPGYRLPALLTIAAMAYGYVLMSRTSGLSAWNVLLAPFAATIFIYALLRSMVITLRQGGVMWRGTFYPLGELKKNVVPLFRA